MPLNQILQFPYNAQAVGLSAERDNLAGVFVLNALKSWVHKDRLNNLNVFTATVVKTDVDISKIFLEREVFIPGFNFRGIITGLNDLKDNILKITIKEKGWHLNRRLYKIEDSLKEYNIKSGHKDDLPQLLIDTIRSMNADMPIVDKTVIPGLVSLWKLNDDALDSKGSNDGTWIGTPVYTKGKFYNDQAALFDGTNYIKTTVSAHEHNTPFSFSFIWQGKVTANSIRIISNETVNNDGIILYWRTVGAPSLFLRDVFVGSDFIEKQLNTRIDDGKLYVITVTYDGLDLATGITWYVNGVKDSNTSIFSLGTFGTNSLITIEDLTIGAIPQGTQIITGMLDDVRDYNIKLSDKQVLKLFKQTQSGIDTIIERDEWKLGEGEVIEINDLVSLWRLDGNALDSKGTNDGTWVNTELYSSAKYLKGYLSNGTNYITIPDFPTANYVDDEMTATAIIKFNSPNNNKAIFNQWRNSVGVNESWYMGTDGNGKLSVFISENSTTVLKNYVSVQVITDDKFHIVGFTYKAGVLKLFIDGLEVVVTKPTDIVGTGIADSTRPIAIAALDASGVYGNISTAGSIIDDCRIYVRALASNEMRRLSDAQHSYIDNIRLDEIPAYSIIDFDIKWKFYYDVLKLIAINSSNDIWFKNNKVMFGTKGKTINLDRDDKLYQDLSTKIDLDAYANIVNVVGAEVAGVNVHATQTNSDTNLLYNYEKVISNNNLKDQASVDGVVGRILGDFDSINPDVVLVVNEETITKYNMESGDILKIISNSESQTVKGFYRIIDVTLSSTKSAVKLQFSKTGKFLPRISDSLELLSAAMLKIQDIELNS